MIPQKTQLFSLAQLQRLVIEPRLCLHVPYTVSASCINLSTNSQAGDFAIEPFFGIPLSVFLSHNCLLKTDLISLAFQYCYSVAAVAAATNMARSDPTPVNTLVLRAPPGYTWVFRYLIAPRNGSKVGVKGAYALITMRCRYKLYLTDWNSVDPATPMFSTSVENDNHGSGALPSRRSRRPAKTTESNQWVDTNPISFRAGAETIKFFNS